MKILIQHTKSGLYLQDEGVWTGGVGEALDFGSSNRALKFLRRNHLQDVQVLAAFIEPTCVETVALPIAPVRMAA